MVVMTMMITDHKAAVQQSLRVLEIVTLKRVSECQVLAPPPYFFHFLNIWKVKQSIGYSRRP